MPPKNSEDFLLFVAVRGRCSRRGNGSNGRNRSNRVVRQCGVTEYGDSVVAGGSADETRMHKVERGDFGFVFGTRVDFDDGIVGGRVVCKNDSIEIGSPKMGTHSQQSPNSGNPTIPRNGSKKLKVEGPNFQLGIIG